MALVRLQVTVPRAVGRMVLDQTWTWPDNRQAHSSDGGQDLQALVGALCRLGGSLGGSGLGLGTLRMVTFDAPPVAMPQASDDTTLTLRPDDRLVCLYEEWESSQGSAWVTDVGSQGPADAPDTAGLQHDALCTGARAALHKVLEDVVEQRLDAMDENTARERLLLIAEKAFEHT